MVVYWSSIIEVCFYKVFIHTIALCKLNLKESSNRNTSRELLLIPQHSIQKEAATYVMGGGQVRISQPYIGTIS